ncbi:MAG: hypothetical protein V1871_00770 [Planctomycetota bacterium]
MERPLGTCCKCGEEIGPYARAGKDWLCKECFYKTLWRGEWQPTPRRNGTRIPTPYERAQQDKWKDAIHNKIDMENNVHRKGAEK